MGCDVKEDKGTPKGGSKLLSLSRIILILLNISNFIVPGKGFVLRSCRISFNVAICRHTDASPKLRAVPQDIPSMVEGLDLSTNNISKIKAFDFKNLTVLTQLDLKNNHISQIDPGAFTDLVSLKTLNLNNNNFVKLRDGLFDGLRNLTELRLHKNRIKVVASTCFKFLTSLTMLDISNNKLHQLSKVQSILQQLPQLRDLSISNNDITTFQSSQVTNTSLQLTSLDLSQNPIVVFRITADVFPNLTRLNLGNLKKKLQIWDVHNKTFLRQVSSLDISGFSSPLKEMKTLLESVNSSLTFLKMNGMRQSISALINISCTVPTMSKLQLRKNRLYYVGSHLFHLCSNVTELDLGDNKIKNIQDEAFTSIPGLRILTLNQNRLSSVQAATRNLTTLSELDLSKNQIRTLGCHDFANLIRLRQLNLYQNFISGLEGCVFKDLLQLQVLKLQNNSIPKLNGTFKHNLPNLRQLHLNLNKLTAIECGELEGLHSLQNLSLHDNQIRKLENGSFRGLTSLTDIQLQSNAIEKEEIEKGGFNDLISLRRLDLRNNHIRYFNSSPLSTPPFHRLSRLEILAFPVQRRRRKSHLPCNILQGLTSLLVFNVRNGQLLNMSKDMFKYTPQLQMLDISSNELMDLSPDLFSPIQGLKSLYISRINLRSLDFLIDANLTKLEFIQARKNAFSVISEDILKSLPSLVYMDLQYNSFTCDCDNAWFLQWMINSNQTQVFDAYNYECNYPPDLKGTRLLDFDIQSCSVSTDFICFVSTTCTILLFMLVSFAYHFLRWQLAYAYYLFLALLFDTKNKNRKTPNQYDAFVSYNIHDEPWVIGEMLPKLEEEQGWRLCLHHRDFEPGKPIMENITDGIYGSRKTLCVISRRYLESEWCSREIQVASFRLFDEQKDVLVLVFLEDIPSSQLSPYYRMRKLLKRRTYLSWPRAKECPELFWEKLRHALMAGEDLREGEDRLLLTVMDRP